MRDTNDDMIELLDVSCEGNIYSSLIRCIINGEILKLRFGIMVCDYGALKRILQFRPFENTGVASYHYFFALSYRFIKKEIVYASIRVEQLKQHKQFEFEISKKYMSNLLWFSRLSNIGDVKDMIEN